VQHQQWQLHREEEVRHKFEDAYANVEEEGRRKKRRRKRRRRRRTHNLSLSLPAAAACS
jgi:hypothetical protein